jgi:hypothetical protein
MELAEVGFELFVGNQRLSILFEVQDSKRLQNVRRQVQSGLLSAFLNDGFQFSWKIEL